MAFVSMMFFWIFLAMAAVGLVFLFIAMIFLLVNRRRQKRGQEKKRGYQIAKIFFLVLAGINLAPLLFVITMSVVLEFFGMAYDTGIHWIMGGIGIILLVAAFFVLKNEKRRQRRWIGRVCLVLGCIGAAPVVWSLVNPMSEGTSIAAPLWTAVMPEQAVLVSSPLEEETEAEEQEFMEYRDARWLALPYEPEEGIRKLKFSKPKAYLQYRIKDLESGEETMETDGSFVYEVETGTGMDLLCTGNLGKYNSKVTLGQLFCREDQYEQFIQDCRTDAEYYLVQKEKRSDDDYDEEEEESERLAIPDSGWITNEMLDFVKNEQHRFLAPETYYKLYMNGMDGMLSWECNDICIGNYEGQWYYYNTYVFDQEDDSEQETSYVANGSLLPEEGQRCMDTLIGQKND